MLKAVIVREKVTRLVKILTERAITVTQRGAQAYVKYDPRTYAPTVVNIPYIPDDAGDDYLAAIEGFLDHEVAHVLFSDAKVLAKAHKLGESVASLHNIIEDPFIERKMADRFSGSAHNLANVGRFFLQNYTDKELAKGGEPLNYLIVPAIRAMSGQRVYQDYMDDGNKWAQISDFMSKVGDYLKEMLPLVETSQDGLDITLEVKRRLSDDSRGEGGGEGEDAESGTPEPKSGKKGKGKGTPVEEPSPESEGEGSDDAGEELSGEDEAGEGSAAAASDGEGEGDGAAEGGTDPSEDEESESSGSNSSTSGVGEDGKPSGERPDEESGEAKDTPDIDPGATLTWDALAEAAEKGFDDGVSEALSEKSIEESKASDYVVYTKDHDRIEVLEIRRPEAHEHQVKQMVDAVDHMIGPLQKDLERAVAARSAATWTAGHRSGRLNGSALARLTAFNDDRAFRRKHDTMTRDVAVSLVIDCSGSMAGAEIRIASYAAYGLSAVLDRMNIASEVIGFTTRGSFGSESGEEMARTGVRYARVEPIFMPVFKEFNERVTPIVKTRVAAMTSAHWLANNVDGESIQYASIRLGQRRESRKIMIVLSDGAPACSSPAPSGTLDRHLVSVINEIERDGVEVLGIGINSNAVEKYYKKSVVLRNLQDLPTSVIAQVKALLIRA